MALGAMTVDYECLLLLLVYTLSPKMDFQIMPTLEQTLHGNEGQYKQLP